MVAPAAPVDQAVPVLPVALADQAVPALPVHHRLVSGKYLPSQAVLGNPVFSGFSGFGFGSSGFGSSGSGNSGCSSSG